MYGTSTSGNGVWGVTTSSNGAGVLAQGNGASTNALAISNGAIKVTGAGNGTQTVAFIQAVHTGTGGNTCDSNGFTIIDNPYTNGDPNAILLVTSSATMSGFYINGVGTRSVAAVYGDIPIVGCPANKWMITPTGGNPFSNGEKYNIMVIKP